MKNIIIFTSAGALVYQAQGTQTEVDQLQESLSAIVSNTYGNTIELVTSF